MGQLQIRDVALVNRGVASSAQPEHRQGHTMAEAGRISKSREEDQQDPGSTGKEDVGHT